MWSASTKYAPFQPSAFTAALASSRTLAGSLWTMLCSRLDLFQTGATSTPRSLGLHESRELGPALVRETVADAHAVFW